MNRRFAQSAIAILLSAILSVTSLTMAVARGQTRVAGEFVICTGYGITTIQVDENGEPVGPVHLCPDMVLGLMAALDTPTPTLTRPEGQGLRLEPLAVVLSAGLAAPQPRARDPPTAA